MGEGGVKNYQKLRDVIYGRPRVELRIVPFAKLGRLKLTVKNLLVYIVTINSENWPILFCPFLK
jgi:hypothetical protein